MGRLPKGFAKPAAGNPRPSAASTPATSASSSAPPASKDAKAGQGKGKKNAQNLDLDLPEQVEAPEPAAVAPAAAAAAAAAATAVPTTDSDGEAATGGDGAETHGQLLQRHKREVLALKKNLQRLGKKSKEDLVKATEDLERKHVKELKDFEDKEKADAAAAALAKLSAEDDKKQPTKAQKRKEKLAKQEEEREARIAEEKAAAGPSQGAVEEGKLKALLKPHGLGIRDIRADGHCLYRALEDQLQQAATVVKSGVSTASAPRPVDHLALRKLAARHIRAHPEDFLPFLYDEDAAGSEEEQLEAYCSELESTAVWGGQLELGALAQALEHPITVYTVGQPPITLGQEFRGVSAASPPDDSSSSKEPLVVCYLRHAFGLGEHYNSCEALVQELGGEEEDGDSAGEDEED